MAGWRGLPEGEVRKEGELSCDNRPSREPKTHEKVAQATQVSTATAARAQALVTKRPFLASEVAASSISLTEGLARPKPLREPLIRPRLCGEVGDGQAASKQAGRWIQGGDQFDTARCLMHPL